MQTPSYFVETLLASWRLPPKAAVSAYGRHSFVGGIRNGGLDFVKAAVGLNLGHGNCLLNDGFFSFAVVRQKFSLNIKFCTTCKFFSPYSEIATSVTDLKFAGKGIIRLENYSRVIIS